MRARKAIPVFGAFLLAVSGCSTQEYSFTRKTEETVTVIVPKHFSEPTYLEPNVGNPAIDANNRTVNGFNLASNGTQAYLAASFYDSVSTLYRGYTRLYDPGTGWSGAGTKDFSVVASHTTSLGHASIAASASGLFMATFFSASTNVAVNSHYEEGYWRAGITKTGLTGYPTAVGTDHMGFGPAVVSAFEADDAAVIYSGLDTPLEVHRFHWDSTNGMNTTGADESSGAGSGAARRRVQALHDGDERVCLTFEANPGSSHQLYGKCYNTSDAATESVTLLSSDTVSGHSSATDGEGTVLVAFYQLVSGKYEVMVTKSVQGTWSSSATQVSSESASGYNGIPSVAAAAAGQSPGVAYLGSGKYLVAWVGVNSSSESAILYSIYDPATGWSAAQVRGAAVAYTTRPSHENLVLLGGGSDLAVLAVTTITTEDAGATHLDTRKLTLSYYTGASGWSNAVLRGNGCKPGAAAKLAACTHRPVGAVFSQGTALVVFPDKDGADRFRLASVELK